VSLNAWAARWQLSPSALQELRGLMGVHEERTSAPGTGEAAVSQQARLKASRYGVRLWRNNVGATMDATGQRMIRYGLANDSAGLNKKIKSSDLIGITPYVVQQHDVGRILGLFTAYETKRSGWKYTGTAREIAQAAWGQLIISLGGIFKFVSSPEDLY